MGINIIEGGNMKQKYLEETKDEFIYLTNDVLFKSVMMRNKNILRRFLVELLNLKVDDSDKIVFLNKELIKDQIKEKGGTVDIYVKIGDKYFIDIEMNKSSFSTVKIRNYLYVEKLHSLMLEEGDEYKALKANNLYQLNLNANESKKIIPFDNMTEISTITGIKTMECIQRYSVNLAYYEEMYYNEVEEMSFSEIFMAGLMSKNYNELYERMSIIFSPEELNKFMGDVINMGKKYFSIHAWEKEKLDALVQDNIREEAIEEGLEKGREEGLTIGRAEGFELKTIEMIQNMLKENTDYEYISKVSGKTIEEIKEIEKNINKK